MNILHMKYAVEVAKTHSISKAAKNLYMGQPNLSRAIKELEESLGITIFRRTTKGMTTTPDGEEFLQRARKIVAEVDEIEEIYRGGRTAKQTFSVCVPRASYFSYAMELFSGRISLDTPAEVYYKETGSLEALNSIGCGEFNMGIIRYRKLFEKDFRKWFEEKRLVSETVTELPCLLLTKKGGFLDGLDEIRADDLLECVEILHGDYYVPSVSPVDVKKAVLSDYTDKHMYVYERDTQFRLLCSMEKAYMWTPPIPKTILESRGLVMKTFSENLGSYKDVLIYRSGYNLSPLDKAFITDVCEARRNCLE